MTTTLEEPTATSSAPSMPAPTPAPSTPSEDGMAEWLANREVYLDHLASRAKRGDGPFDDDEYCALESLAKIVLRNGKPRDWRKECGDARRILKFITLFAGVMNGDTDWPPVLPAVDPSPEVIRELDAEVDLLQADREDAAKKLDGWRTSAQQEAVTLKKEGAWCGDRAVALKKEAEAGRPDLVKARQAIILKQAVVKKRAAIAKDVAKVRPIVIANRDIAERLGLHIETKAAPTEKAGRKR